MQESNKVIAGIIGLIFLCVLIMCCLPTSFFIASNILNRQDVMPLESYSGKFELYYYQPGSYKIPQSEDYARTSSDSFFEDMDKAYEIACKNFGKIEKCQLEGNTIDIIRITMDDSIAKQRIILYFKEGRKGFYVEKTKEQHLCQSGRGEQSWGVGKCV